MKGSSVMSGGLGALPSTPNRDASKFSVSRWVVSAELGCAREYGDDCVPCNDGLRECGLLWGGRGCLPDG